jgi:hypothetical protein
MAEAIIKKFMKKKIILIAVLAIVFGSGAVLFTPRSVLAQTNAPSTDRKVLYYTCPMHPSVKSDKPGNCPDCGMTLEPVYADDSATNNMDDMATNVPSGASPDNGKPTPYPLTTCVVSGEKLGEMGEPIEFIYTNNGANQEIKFCCPMCKSKFLKDPDNYMKKIRDAEAAAQK